MRTTSHLLQPSSTTTDALIAEAQLIAVNDRFFYQCLGVEEAREQNALLLEEEVNIAVRKCADLRKYSPILKRNIDLFTQQLNLHYELLTYIPKEEKPMPTITLTNHEETSPLSTVLICAGKRLDAMSEGDIVNTINDYQNQIDKLKTVKVKSTKIQKSITTLQAQLTELVAAYDAM